MADALTPADYDKMAADAAQLQSVKLAEAWLKLRGKPSPYTPENLRGLCIYLCGLTAKAIDKPRTITNPLTSKEIAAIKASLKANLKTTTAGQAAIGFVLPVMLLWFVIDAIITLVLRYFLSQQMFPVL